MSYEVDSRLKHLSEKIKIIKERSFVHIKNQEIVALETSFQLSDLIANLIAASKLECPFPTLYDLKQFHAKYSIAGIDLKKLIDTHWIRIVMNRIEIPNAIKEASENLKKLPSKELDFVVLFQSFLIANNKDSISSEEFDKIIEEYNHKNKPLITRKEISERSLVSTVGFSQNYSLRSYAKYWLYLVDHRKELEFIESFAKEYSMDGHARYYQIEKQCAEDIITLHKLQFPSAPQLSDLVEQNFLKEVKDSFLFKISHGDHADWWSTLSESIAAKLWIKLENKEFKLDNWLDLIVINSNYPVKVLSHFADDTRRDFISLIKKRILEEKDILGNSEEIPKVSLEQTIRNGWFALLDPLSISFQDGQSIGEKYRIAKDFESLLTGIESRTRQRINLLLHILIQEASASKNSIHSFTTIKNILKEYDTRPYLVWKIAQIIVYQRPEIIPYILKEPGIQELGILLIPLININNFLLEFAEREDLSLNQATFNANFHRECLSMLLHILSEHKQEEAAVLLCKSIIEISKSVFREPTNYDANQQFKSIQIESYEKTWEMISRFRINTMAYIYEAGSDRPLYLFYLLKDFVKEINNYKEPPYRNEFYSPQLWRQDILIRLLKTILDPFLFPKELYQEDHKMDMELVENLLLDTIHANYMDALEKEEIQVSGDPTSSPKLQKLKFRSSNYGVAIVQWHHFLKTCKKSYLRAFFNKAFPDIVITAKENIYSAEIENKIHRLRFHCRVMLASHNALMIESLEENSDLITKLEEALTDCFCQYSTTEISSGTVDIFDKNYDIYTGGHLFGELLDAANTFTSKNRKKILGSIIEHKHFERTLWALNLIVSDGDKNDLLTELSDEKLENFLKSVNFMDIENALVNTVNNPNLSDFTNKILEYIEKNKLPALDKYDRESLLFHVRLILAYRNKDRASLLALEPPKDRYDNYSAKRLANIGKRIEFEIHLLYGEGKLDAALERAKKLAFERKEDPGVIDLKFSLEIEASKIYFDTDISKGHSMVTAALKWFDSSIKDCNPKLYTKFIESNILLHRMICYDLLGNNDLFDGCYLQLKPTDKYLEHFSEVIVRNKLRRSQFSEASSFVEDLSRYHLQRSNKPVEFAERLRSEISSHSENLTHLRQSYKDIITLSEEQRIRVLPDVISKNNGAFDLFILGEFVRATTDLQNKYYSTLTGGQAPEDISEDKITDLLELVVNSRLSAWQMRWSSQNRIGTTAHTGVSGTATNELARVDLSAKMGFETLGYEAMRLYNGRSVYSQRKNITDHVLKGFNQTATRKSIFYAFYYQSRKYEKDWDELKKQIENMQFPDRFSRKGSFDDLAEFSTSDLKVAVTHHENDVKCYYIYANFNYSNTKP